jgi:hypothetical protein
MNEQDLVRKLVTTWHLNVPERAALPNRRLRVSLACQTIVDVLSEHAWFPSDGRWRPDQGYDGGVIERIPDGTYNIHWKGEISVMRFALLSVDHYNNAHDAAIAWLRGMFPRDIDGVEIDWTS